MSEWLLYPIELPGNFSNENTAHSNRYNMAAAAVALFIDSIIEAERDVSCLLSLAHAAQNRAIYKRLSLMFVIVLCRISSNYLTCLCWAARGWQCSSIYLIWDWIAILLGTCKGSHVPYTRLCSALMYNTVKRSSSSCCFYSYNSFSCIEFGCFIFFLMRYRSSISQTRKTHATI